MAEVIKFGVPVTSTIGNAGQSEGYTFKATKGDQISVAMGSEAINPQIKFYAPSGDLIAEKSDWYSNDIGLLAKANQTGTYTVLVSDIRGYQTGDYGLTVQRTNRPGNATAAKFGVPLTDTIDNSGEEDSYSFTAQKGDQISVDMGSGAINPQIKFYAPSGDLIAEKSDWYSNDIGLLAKANQTGTYTVLVSDIRGYQTGDYGLTVQRTNHPGNATAAKFGVPLTDTIGNPGEVDSYSFTAKKGDQISVDMGSEAINPQIKFYGPSGDLIAEKSDWYSNDIGLLANANQTGTYTVLVSDIRGYQTGDYGLTVQRTNHPGNATPIKNLSSLSDTINNLGQVDAYSFTGQAGTKISFSMGSDAINPEIELYSPDGLLIRSVADWYSQNMELVATLTQNGAYTVLVSDTRGYQTGDYGVTLASLGKPKGLTKNGTSKSEEIKGDYGYDTLNGGSGNDTLSGYDGQDKLIGGDGKDILSGGIGEDVLDGGKSSDTLTGEQGRDQFLFKTNSKFKSGDIGIDTIADFGPDIDKIVLDKTTFNSLSSKAGNGFSTNTEFAVVKTDEAADRSKGEIVYNSTNGNLFYNPNGVVSGSSGGGLFAVLTGNPKLTASDFVLQN
ncbi:hemolysin-type calcium-binding region [Planktothrix agardhii NIES-204]|jgi:Ca2+-binding RTX toxin-like protein|nr:hemolysin-type calcium-binding region [Planktothrix agardhii NIES-204]